MGRSRFTQESGLVYAAKVQWTHFNGTKQCVGVSNYDNLHEALDDALLSAIVMGWTMPRWWQWWRWQDTRVTWDMIAKAIKRRAILGSCVSA